MVVSLPPFLSIPFDPTEEIVSYQALDLDGSIGVSADRDALADSQLDE
jgi:hypothetical protein